MNKSRTETRENIQDNPEDDAAPAGGTKQGSRPGPPLLISGFNQALGLSSY